jgi:hypothetical protein
MIVGSKPFRNGFGQARKRTLRRSLADARFGGDLCPGAPLNAQIGNSGRPVNFQVLRRRFATNAQGLGNPKDVQTHLRHSDVSTTLNEYTQPIPESVRKLVNAVAEDVMSSEPERRLQ